MVDIIDQVRCIGYDKNGIRCAVGVGSTRDIAESRCQEVAMSYIKTRPDTGPLSEWSWTFDKRAS